MNVSRPVVVITGSTGLIGSRLRVALVERYQVVGLDITPPEDLETVDYAAEFIQCDLTDADSVNGAVRQIAAKHSRIASVVHLAAYYDFAGEPSPLYDDLTVDGTRRLLTALQSLTVEQFVFCSSLLVMKPVEEGETITEASPVEGSWDYPESKLRAEEALRQHRGDIPAVVLRLAGVYDEDGHSVPVAQQIRRIYEKELESYLFPGDADHGQAFIHLQDAVDCFVRVIERRHQLGLYEVLLVAEPDVMSYEELQDRIGEGLHGKEWPTIRIPKVVAKAGAWLQDKLAGDEATFIKPWMVDLADQHYPVAIDRARRLLGWEPERRLRSTLDEMLRRLKRDPQAWYQANGFDPSEA